jgi:hypothetical protein
VVLIVLGVFVLVYRGFTYTKEKKVLDLGPIEATKKSEEHVPVPPILGGLALAGGVVLVVSGARKSN